MRKIVGEEDLALVETKGKRLWGRCCRLDALLEDTLLPKKMVVNSGGKELLEVTANWIQKVGLRLVALAASTSIAHTQVLCIFLAAIDIERKK